MPLIKIACVTEGCRSKPLVAEADIPEWAVGAFAMAFHSDHEGHRTRLEVDGVQIYPPRQGPVQ